MATHSSIFLPEKSHRQRSLAGYSPWGRSQTALSTYTRTHSLKISESFTHQRTLTIDNVIKIHTHKAKGGKNRPSFSWRTTQSPALAMSGWLSKPGSWTIAQVFLPSLCWRREGQGGQRCFSWSRIPRCPGVKKLETWEEETRKRTDGSACLQSPTNI